MHICILLEVHFEFLVSSYVGFTCACIVLYCIVLYCIVQKLDSTIVTDVGKTSVSMLCFFQSDVQLPLFATWIHNISHQLYQIGLFVIVAMINRVGFQHLF